MQDTPWGGGPQSSNYPAVFPGGLVIRLVSTDQRTRTNGTIVTNPQDAWSARSAWPGHPAVLPPLPRIAKSEALAAPPFSRLANSVSQLEHTGSTHRERPSHGPHRAQAVTGARSAHRRHDERGDHKVLSRPSRGSGQGISSSGVVTGPADHLEHLQWPASFDDWMMDIVRRRALRLNSGARRRGVRGSVRAVDLAHILDRSADSEGRWRCALCHAVVTLNDLSFDHVVALADGGEHAPYNLVPAHRKCNEIKGSEKAQYRAQALDRWLSDWASTAKAPAERTGATPTVPARHAGYLAGVASRSDESARRYA
jgi:5-methylcytosine-specific restriction endonuclease McrA